MKTLWPPLALLETELFSPSDALIERWRSGAELPVDLQRALDADPDAHVRRTALETALSTDPEIGDAAPVPPMPPDVQAMIRQRVASRQATFSRLPTSGQIVRMDEVRGPNGSLHWDLPRPLTVLLVEPTTTRQVWYGWLVTAESDYAGYWDLLLGAADEPCDPLARMVQLWNPVHVYLPSVSRVLAELTPGPTRSGAGAGGGLRDGPGTRSRPGATGPDRASASRRSLASYRHAFGRSRRSAPCLSAALSRLCGGGARTGPAGPRPTDPDY